MSKNSVVKIACSLFVTLSWHPTVSASDAEPAVVKLAQDPAFVESLDLMFDEMRGVAVQLSQMSPAQRNKYLEASRDYARQLKAANDLSPAAPAAFRQHTLLRQQTVNRWVELIDGLRERHPAIRNQAQVGAASARSGYTDNGIEYGFSDVDSTYCNRVDCSCLSRCNEEYRQAVNDAGFGWWLDSVFDPRPFGFIFGWIEMSQQIHEFGVQRLDCLEGCRGVDFPNRCFEDSDCESGKYCRHVFGNPYHSCTDQKALGETCSRHEKCQSGCCKFHPGTNPFAKVCRPSDRCD
jgi:hypothetical protein